MNLFPLVKKNYLIIVVLFFSLLFRVTNLDLIEFKADEGINLFLASRPIFGHEFVPGGTVSSIGITNFPLINYILLPFTLISLDPKVISFLIGLLNSLAIVAFFIIVRKYYNQTIALISSLLIATSPWAILFSRKIWAQDFLLPLFIPFFLSIHKIIIDKDEKYWALYSFSALLLIQIHQSVFFFAFPLTIFMILYKVKVNYKFLTIGTITGLILTLHFVYYQLTSGCFDCKMLITSGQRVSADPSFLLFIRPLQLLNQGNFFPTLGEDVVYFASNFPLAYLLKPLYYFEYLLIPLGIFIFFKSFKRLGLVIFPVILLPFIYAFFKLEPHIHYFIIISPFLYLFLGVALHFFLSYKKMLVKYAACGIFAALISLSIYYNYAFYETIDHLKNIKGDYGLIFSIKLAETEKKYSPYKTDPSYNEMIIASYVPYGLTRGNIGISRMLFEPKKTERNMISLEERLKIVPVDRRIQQELIAYYTRRVPTKKTVRMLRNKSLEIIGFEPIYQEAREYYNENNRESPI